MIPFPLLPGFDDHHDAHGHHDHGAPDALALTHHSHPSATHIDHPVHLGHALSADPGHSAFQQHMALPDPLVGMHDFQFSPYTHDAHHGRLLDLDGDGVMDSTTWGTPVERVHEYVRADGTHVHGHYRTVANGFRLDNLNR